MMFGWLENNYLMARDSLETLISSRQIYVLCFEELSKFRVGESLVWDSYTPRLHFDIRGSA